MSLSESLRRVARYVMWRKGVISVDADAPVWQELHTAADEIDRLERELAEQAPPNGG